MEKISRRSRHETVYDKLQRYRGAILMISVPVLLITLLFFLMPSRNPANSILSANRKIPASPITGYAVIFDAGSSGSRVHVFHFDEQLNLIPIGKELELFEQKKPGLSSFAKDPKAAADSLLELLEKAEAVVPREMQQNTPVRVGATAGLRQLDGDAPDRILQAVRDLLKNRGTFKSKADWVTVLDGNQEGAYQWVTINYLLGNLGKEYASTVGVVDLGGGSVQMAYAISDADAAKAPKLSDGENTYVQKMYLKGRKYNLYVHSYLHYGLLAARAEILKVGESGNLCTLSGYSDTVFLCIGSELPVLQKPVTPVGEEIRSWISLSNLLRFFTQGSYKYGGAEYDASSASSGSSLSGCREAAVKALKINEPACTHMKCTFGGVWNGGGGDGQNNLFVASFFFDRAAEAGFVDPSKPVAKVRPADFEDAAKIACQMKLTDAKSKYRGVHPDNLPYLCMDLVYEYTLLTDGFGLDPQQEMTLVKKVEYKNSLVEAAWPLGSAIEVMSLKT